MKAYLSYLIVFLLTFSLTSCEVVGGIFKTGMWAGVIVVVAVIAVVIWLLSRVFGGGRR
ncbi:hypothetical protein DYBT9623_04331 [Dyadobacter sp. CECT 9623]|jgi:cytosine/uracil/thiamine/allantoin permease|uniref:Phosphatidate cytidylyltransferase n=1 Tax=Dyadobacter linearis TaxID=2823330 RepID=A0ABM8UVG3_9BACT|nr:MULTISPECIES: hypothetical protein [unclassified Dyadobacter]MCE7059146.1 hypothetical protein [Dyadobacter sp. CY343]CAG5072791.1 hypothetical protein DYBT9623_04331 [Dyadobacter sp. CECT 9623]